MALNIFTKTSSTKTDKKDKKYASSCATLALRVQRGLDPIRFSWRESLPAETGAGRTQEAERTYSRPLCCIYSSSHTRAGGTHTPFALLYKMEPPKKSRAFSKQAQRPPPAHRSNASPAAPLTVCALVENRARETCIAVINTSHFSVIQVCRACDRENPVHVCGFKSACDHDVPTPGKRALCNKITEQNKGAPHIILEFSSGKRPLGALPIRALVVSETRRSSMVRFGAILLQQCQLSYEYLEMLCTAGSADASMCTWIKNARICLKFA